jgi:curved DNA-binding protein CbpA
MRTETIHRSLVSLGVEDDDGRRRSATTAASSPSSNAPFDDDSEDLYEILNLSQPYESLTKRDIKTAFRKRALETHPDRNKKPNASEEFNKCKRAYNTLSDDRLRKEYDRKRLFWKKNGGNGSSSRPWTTTTSASSSSSSSYARPPKQQQRQKAEEEETFYGFSDFFRDVEKEFEERERRKGRDPSKPKSIWEELETLGEEFVEFLEENERKDFQKYDDAREEAAKKTRNDDSTNGGGNSSASRESSSYSKSSSSASSKATIPPKSDDDKANKKVAAKDESVEDMLRALKKQMGKS